MKSGKFRTRLAPEPLAGSNGLLNPSVAHIGKYEIETEIESVKHARIKVFRAIDRDIGRPVTLKQVTDTSDRQLAQRFRREVSCIAKLRVTTVVAIYELGEHAGLPFAAMQHLGDDHLGLAIKGNRT